MNLQKQGTFQVNQCWWVLHYLFPLCLLLLLTPPPLLLFYLLVLLLNYYLASSNSFSRIFLKIFGLENNLYNHQYISFTLWKRKLNLGYLILNSQILHKRYSFNAFNMEFMHSQCANECRQWLFFQEVAVNDKNNRTLVLRDSVLLCSSFREVSVLPSCWQVALVFFHALYVSILEAPGWQ